MSDGGFDVDELLRTRRNSLGYSVSYPYLSNDKVDYFQKSKISNNHESIISKNAKCEISKKKKSIENFRNINIAGKIQETYKCIDCLKKEKCKLEAQGSLDLCKKPFLLAT